MRTIIISGTDLVPNDYYGNKFRYDFPVGSVSFKDDQIAVSSVQMYYSWFNITSSNTGSRYNNNVFQYQWYGAAPIAVSTITIPDGYYSVATLNAYLQSQMVANGHYLVDSFGDYVYYLEFVENPSAYAVQLNSFPIPTALPALWTNPAGMTFPAVATTPQIIILSTNNFKDVIGFNAGTYPSPTQATNYSKTSDYTPQVSPVSSIVMTCSLVQNRYSVPNTLIYSFTPAGTAFGDIINVQPSELAFNDISDTTVNSIEITFLDQNLRDIKLNDSQLVVLLVIKNKFEYTDSGGKLMGR
jgi:hypothetical protein